MVKVKEENKKGDLKLNIQKMIVASDRFTSWQIDGETVSDFIFLGSKTLQMVTAAMKLKDTYSLDETNLESISNSIDITLPTKVHLAKAMVFPVVMYGCECWTINKAEHRRMDSSELWCWRRRSNQSILKEINPEYSLERLMLKLKLQYFGHLV